MLFFAVLSAVSLFFGSLVQGYSNPGACSGACVVHDPAVIQRTSDGTYFRFSTGNKISIATASSIAGPWTAIGSALPSGSKINLDGNDDLWAPDISKVGNNYYLLYSVSTFGSQNSAIGYATSTTMEVGSWTDGGALFQSKTGDAYNAIDGNLHTSSGNRYLQFGSFWTDIFQVPLNSAATASSGTATNIAFDPSGTHPVEGAFLYQHGGYYYLFFSHGICCGYDSSRPAAGEEYKIKVCRSTSPTGSFVDASGVACTSGGGTVVLESHGTVYGPGGQGVITHPSLGPVLFYHYVDTTIGYADGQKQFGWNQITWTNNWPTI